MEVLGWLELPLDDAPRRHRHRHERRLRAEQWACRSVSARPAARALGLEDNDRRYARDNYALNLLAASRRLQLVAGRRGPENEPLVPSRLLFACDGQEDELAQRRGRFLAPRPRTRPPWNWPAACGPEQPKTEFAVPRPVRLAEPVTSLRVTELRDYLACPYRYYLRHRLELEALADAAEELAANDFGSLLHTVLKEFADSPLADSTDRAAIASGLSEILNDQVAERFGSAALAAVRLQAEQIRFRLSAFAAWQAAVASQGLEDPRHRMQRDGGKSDHRPRRQTAGEVFLRGRIDRIDVHESTGETIVFDYKTGDRAQSPGDTHLEQGTDWIDLQLPMYRHLVRAVPHRAAGSPGLYRAAQGRQPGRRAAGRLGRRPAGHRRRQGPGGDAGDPRPKFWPRQDRHHADPLVSRIRRHLPGRPAAGRSAPRR